MRSLIDFKLNNFSEILLFSVAAIALLAIIVVVILILILKKTNENYLSQIDDSSNTLRIFVVNVKDDQVSYFNSSYLKRRKTSSITSFYNQFPSHERERLINWVGELLEAKEETPKFLEIHVYIKAKKINVPSLLQVQKIDFDRQIIYLESHLLKYVNNKTHKKGEHRSFVNKDIFTKKVLEKNGKGATFCINFFNKTTKTNDFSRFAYVDLKNILSSFIQDDLIMTEHEFGKIIFSVFVNSGKISQFALIDSIKTRINRFLLIESFADEIDYTFGVIENSVYFRDVNNLIKNAIALSEMAKDDDNNQVMFFSDKKNSVMEDNGQQYRTDVEQIIQDNKLIYYFQPIFNFDRNRVMGYQTSIVPIDSYFKNIDDLKKYALRTEDDKELFSTIVKNSISRFVEEKGEENVSLFFPISYNEINFVNRSLGHTSGVSEAHIVLVLKEKELTNITDDNEEGFINSIRSFKSKGYAVALEIDDDVLTLKPTIYALFDYFNLSVASHIQKKNAGSQLPTFQGLIEKLLHYQKPIVATNISTWEIVELVYKLGVNMICSDAIALPAENIIPLPRKIILKIRNFKS